jgi:hypothetical protein
MAESIEVGNEAAGGPAEWKRATVTAGAARWARDEPAPARRLLAAGRATVFFTPAPGTPHYLPPSAGLYAAAFGPAEGEAVGDRDGDGDLACLRLHPDQAAGYWDGVLGGVGPLLDDEFLAGLFFETVQSAICRSGQRS